MLNSYKDEDHSSYTSGSNSVWFGSPYMMQLENFKLTESGDTVFVDFSHIQNADSTLALTIQEQYYR